MVLTPCLSHSLITLSLTFLHNSSTLRMSRGGGGGGGEVKTVHICRYFVLTVASCITVILPGDFSGLY